MIESRWNGGAGNRRRFRPAPASIRYRAHAARTGTRTDGQAGPARPPPAAGCGRWGDVHRLRRDLRAAGRCQSGDGCILPMSLRPPHPRVPRLQGGPGSWPAARSQQVAGSHGRGVLRRRLGGLALCHRVRRCRTGHGAGASTGDRRCLRRWWLLGERPDRRIFVAIPILLSGVVLISGVVGEGAYGSDPLLGVVFGIGTSLAYAGFILLLRQSSKDLRRPAGPLTDATAVAAVRPTAAGFAIGDLDLTPGWPAQGWLVLLALTAQVAGWLLIVVSLPRPPAVVTRDGARAPAARHVDAQCVAPWRATLGCPAGWGAGSSGRGGVDRHGRSAPGGGLTLTTPAKARGGGRLGAGGSAGRATDRRGAQPDLPQIAPSRSATLSPSQSSIPAHSRWSASVIFAGSRTPANPQKTVRSLGSGWKVRPWSMAQRRPSRSMRTCPNLRSALLQTRSSTRSARDAHQAPVEGRGSASMSSSIRALCGPGAERSVRQPGFGDDVDPHRRRHLVGQCLPGRERVGVEVPERLLPAVGLIDHRLAALVASKEGGVRRVRATSSPPRPLGAPEPQSLVR